MPDSSPLGGAGRFAGLFEPTSAGRARLAAAFCVAVALIGGAVQLVLAVRDARREAIAYVGLSYADRNIGGGNSIVVDQEAAFTARAVIPPDSTYEVRVGPPRADWTALTPGSVVDWYRADLLPRRLVDGSPWIICYGCDTAEHEDVDTVWEGEAGISILRRRE